jgi:predicted metal-dependent phosphoesterase TrpH
MIHPVNVELHCHTCYSKDSLMTPANLLAVARRKRIHRLAVTDHNTIDGALEAQALDPARFIVGLEVMTSEGELLAYFVKENVPRDLSPEETIERLRAQGAVIGVSHPYDSIRHGSWEDAALRRILPLIDVIEVFNARTMTMHPNKRAHALAQSEGKPGIAGSDAHHPSEVGAVTMHMPDFETPPEFLKALADAQIVGRRSSPLVHFFSRFATWRKKLGWRYTPPLSD